MINALGLEKIAQIVQGELRGNSSSSVLAVNKDTRTLKAGELYVALKGENFDGHAFIDKAAQQGATAALVEHFADNALAQIKVPNCLEALGQLAQFNRDAFLGPVVAVTGSAGKTSVKQLMHAVLSEKYRTLMTQGNLNNHIGAPLTLLSLNAEHQAAVIELGASGLGEIAYTAKWVKPQVGIITNAAHAHIQGFGSLEGVVQTKGELLDFITPDGCAVLNADDAFCETWVKRAQGKHILRFGLNSSADVCAKHIQLSLSGSEFLLCYQNQQQLVHLPLLGEHNVRNALAVAAAALALDFTLAEIASGLSKAQNVQGRLQWVAGKKGERILNDAYNANPASVRAAIDVLKHSENNFLIMGDMAELGREEIAQHQEMGRYAKAQGIQHFFATGPLSKASVEAFGEGALWFADKKSLSVFLQEQTTAGAVVLVKGSRSAAMDDIVRDLQITSGE